jgi:hypothetical protein
MENKKNTIKAKKPITKWKISYLTFLKPKEEEEEEIN